MESVIGIRTESPTRTAPQTIPVEQCPACRARGANFFFKAIDRLHGVPGEYIYRRCRDCQTVFQDPKVISRDLMLCYPNDYYTHRRQDCARPLDPPFALSQRPLSRLRDRIRRAIAAAVNGIAAPGAMGLLGRWLAASRMLRERAFHNIVSDEFLPGKSGTLRALEVGCGNGQFLRKLQWVGWKGRGVELDPDAAAEARRLSGCQILDGDFRSIKLDQGSYELVVLSHVFEHLDDPHGSLARIEELLSLEGRAVLIYPNPRSLGALILRERWFPWEPPRHLVLPSIRAITNLARETGLSCEARTSARNAPAYSLWSRQLCNGEAVDFDHPVVRVKDRLFGLLERTLVRLGLEVGEEVIAVLKRRQEGA